MNVSRCRAAVASAAVIVLIATVLGGSTSAQLTSAGSEAASPPVRLLQASDSIVAERYGRRTWLELGVWLAAGDEPLEIRAVRPSYRKQIRAWLVSEHGSTPLPVAMPNFARVPRFSRVTIARRNGRVVWERTLGFCPGYESVRVQPDASDTATYPTGCNSRHPFTRGAVYGVDAGWAVPFVGSYGGLQVKLPRGRFRVSVGFTEAFRRLFGLARSDARTELTLRVVDADDGGDVGRRLGAGRGSGAAGPDPVPATPADSEPPRSESVPAAEARPDLRSLPAHGIRLTRRGFLQFSATVWNAGPSPLVIDGFRRLGEDVMDAHQYFYVDGQQVGHQLAGQMQWHAAPQHHHWHFTDFARYRLLDSDMQGIVRSRKESFCLANTDAIDYTVPGANWRPENTDLHTSCGSAGSVAVREVLDSGSGDTYYQSLPGQSFDVRQLPNGTYFVAVEANPEHNLSEVRTDNNVAYRKVILRGSGDQRRVVVPQIGLIADGGRPGQ